MDQNATLNGRIEQEFKELNRGWVAADLQGTTELFDRVWADSFILDSLDHLGPGGRSVFPSNPGEFSYVS